MAAKKANLQNTHRHKHASSDTHTMLASPRTRSHQQQQSSTPTSSSSSSTTTTHLSMGARKIMFVVAVVGGLTIQYFLLFRNGANGIFDNPSSFFRYQQPTDDAEQDEEPELNIPAVIPTKGNFDPNQFDYKIPAERTNYTLPPPARTNQSIIVIVLSARSNFERRAVIRETYAKNNDNIYFVVGGPVPSDAEDMDRNNPLSTSSLLFQEQEHFNDIIDVIHPDTYKSLPFKLHRSVQWIMRNIDHVNWIVKADDDQIVRIRMLHYFVLRKMNPNHPLVIGDIAVGGRPHKTGKWKEDPHFKDAIYPPWPFGSAGYVISRPVAQFLADTDELYYYQGEDAGLGIWLSESPLQVTFIDTPELRNDGLCQDKVFIIGHDLSIDRMRSCFRVLGDKIPPRPHIVAFAAARKGEFPGIIKS